MLQKPIYEKLELRVKTHEKGAFEKEQDDAFILREKDSSADNTSNFGRIFEDSLNEIYLFDADTEIHPSE